MLDYRLADRKPSKRSRRVLPLLRLSEQIILRYECENG